MATVTRPAADFTPEQLRFPPTAGFTVRADFAVEKGTDLFSILRIL